MHLGAGTVDFAFLVQLQESSICKLAAAGYFCNNNTYLLSPHHGLGTLPTLYLHLRASPGAQCCIPLETKKLRLSKCWPLPQDHRSASWGLKSDPFAPKPLTLSMQAFVETYSQQFCPSPLLQLPLSVCERICLQNCTGNPSESTDCFLVTTGNPTAIITVLYTKEMFFVSIVFFLSPLYKCTCVRTHTHTQIVGGSGLF